MVDDEHPNDGHERGEERRVQTHHQVFHGHGVHLVIADDDDAPERADETEGDVELIVALVEGKVLGILMIAAIIAGPS